MIKDFLARIGCLTLIGLVLAGGWWLRDDLAGLWNRLQITASSRPSERLAEGAVDKLRVFTRADGGARLQLAQAEIQSLLTYRVDSLLPPGISDALVEIRDSTLLVSARVDPEKLDGLASPDVVARFLSDSTRVVLELEPGVLPPGVAQVEVVTLQAGSFVVPSLMVPWILEGLELEGVEVTGGTLLIPLPWTVERFEVAGGELVLVRR